MQQTRAAPSTLEAVLERITYANQETGYTVARVATDRSSDLLTVVGPLLGAQPGESLRAPSGRRHRLVWLRASYGSAR
jgi:exodeoxyribonuclease V alpha subunit